MINFLNMRKYIALLIIVLLQSCAWMETKTETVDLIGNLKILTSFDDMSGGISVISEENNGGGLKPLFNNCKSILLDSTNYLIYIKSVSYTEELKYNLVKFEDKNDLNTFKISDITEKDFLLHVKDCNECKLFEWHNNEE